MQQTELSTKKSILVYTGLFMLVSFFTFFWFLLYSKTLVWQADGFTQYYPMLVDFRAMLLRLLRGEGFSFWSWSFDLGEDVLGSYYFLFGNPIWYIAALFPPHLADVGVGFAVYLHFYVAGLGMLAFLRYQTRTDWLCVVGALSYAFSSWSTASIQQAMFHAASLLFPLMMLGVELLHREKRPLLLIFSVAFSLMTSLYFSYMSAFVLACYVLLRFLFQTEAKSLRRFFSWILALAACVAVAVCLSCPVMLPYLRAILQASKENGTHFNSLQQTLKNVALIVPTFLAGGTLFGNYSAASVGFLLVTAWPALFLDWKERRNRMQDLLFGVCTLFLLIPFFSSALNGFNYPSGRWAYALAFFSVWAGISALEPEKFSCSDYAAAYARGLNICCILSAFSLLFAGVLLRWQSFFRCVLGFLTLAVAYAAGRLLLHRKAQQRGRILLRLTAAYLAGFYFLLYYPVAGSSAIDTFLYRGSCNRQYSLSAQKYVAVLEEQDPSFFRSAAEDASNLNEALFYGTRSTTGFRSTLNTNVQAFYKSVCNNSAYALRVTRQGNDGRCRLDYLLGVKYRLLRASEDAQLYYGFTAQTSDDKYLTLNSKHMPSIGYVFPKVISRERYEAYSYLDREQLLMQAAVVENYKGPTPTLQDAQILQDSKSLPFVLEPGAGVTLQDGVIKVEKKNAKLTLTLTSPCSGELYLLLENFIRVPQSYEEKYNAAFPDPNGVTRLEKHQFMLENYPYVSHSNFLIDIVSDGLTKQLENHDGSNQASAGIVDYLVNLGYREKEQSQITLSFSTPGTYHYAELDVYAVGQSYFDDQAAALSTARLHTSLVNNNYIRGTVDSAGGLLFLSIPDNGGWRIWIDGEEVEVLHKLDYGFIGAEMPAGEHIVELRYRPYGFLLSVSLCGLGWLGVGGILLRSMHRYRKQKAKHNEGVA